MNSQSSWPCYFMLLALVCLPANMRAESPDSPPNTAESAAIARTGPQANGSSQQKPLPLAAGPATFGNVPPPMAGPIGPAPGYAPGLAPPAFPPSGIAPASMTAPAGFGPNGAGMGAGMGIGLPPNGPPMGFQGPPNAMPMAGPGGMPPQMMGGPGGMPPQMMGGPNGGVMPAAHMGGGAPGPFAQMGAQPMDGPYSPAGYGVRGNFDVLGYLRYLLTRALYAYAPWPQSLPGSKLALTVSSSFLVVRFWPPSTSKYASCLMSASSRQQRCTYTRRVFGLRLWLGIRWTFGGYVGECVRVRLRRVHLLRLWSGSG